MARNFKLLRDSISMACKVLRNSFKSESGAVSTEYATVAVAACGAGGILYQFLTSSAFSDMLGKILMTAFKWIFNLG